MCLLSKHLDNYEADHKDTFIGFAPQIFSQRAGGDERWQHQKKHIGAEDLWSMKINKNAQRSQHTLRRRPSTSPYLRGVRIVLFYLILLVSVAAVFFCAISAGST